jgi:poly(3-hydroxybutyrate) depolymerase
MGVCQPAVPLLAATAIMEAEGNKKRPDSIVLIGGPIDVRKSPTEINNFAEDRSIKWFEQKLITRVPYKFDGYMRQVYPGFMQLSGFMAMNMNRHIGEFTKLFGHLVDGDGDGAIAHKRFYNEYLAVMDLPSEFYLQTIETVFQTYALPRGKMVSRGRKVDPAAIKNVKLLTIEGERDDISGIGQTKAALKLCRNLPNEMKNYHLQKSVGHYGLFNGRRFNEEIVPVIVDFIKHKK